MFTVWYARLSGWFRCCYRRLGANGRLGRSGRGEPFGVIHLRVVAASAPTGDCQWPEPRALSHQLERLTGRVAHPCMSHRGPLRRRTQEAVWGEAVEAGWTADRPTETEISRAVPDVARRAQTLICAHCDGAGRLHGRSAAAAAANRVPSGGVERARARASERASVRAHTVV